MSPVEYPEAPEPSERFPTGPLFVPVRSGPTGRTFLATPPETNWATPGLSHHPTAALFALARGGVPCMSPGDERPVDDRLCASLRPAICSRFLPQAFALRARPATTH
jgi:hypothetical protein